MENKSGFKNKLSSVFDIVGEIFAFLTIIVYALWAINANWTFITNQAFIDFLEYARTLAPLILVCIVGLEFSVKRNIIIQIIIYALIALVVIFMFFPGTWEAIRAGVGI